VVPKEPLRLGSGCSRKSLEHASSARTRSSGCSSSRRLAGEHAVLIGPPGDGEERAHPHVRALLDANYFEYLLTRFTEPNEIFGPVDIAAFREGATSGAPRGCSPTPRSSSSTRSSSRNSAILNALLTLLNERRYTSGGRVMKCPLSAFGASNEVPTTRR
jgi:MoxR-like ATPase